MSGGRPRTTIGTYGSIWTTGSGRSHAAFTRYRDPDGKLRQVQATGTSKEAAKAELKRRIAERRGYGASAVLSVSSRFGELADLWLADLELRDLVEGTKDNYRDDLRLHVRPKFEHYALGEITTGRVESFLLRERAASYSRLKHSRTLLNMLFGFALRHDAISRNPMEGTSTFTKPKNAPKALTIEQIVAIRKAAKEWRTGPDVKGPKPDGQVRDIVEVLLGSSLRIGEVLALRPVDVEISRRGMLVNVNGTVILRKGQGSVRQPKPKSEASERRIPVAPFAAKVIRERLAKMEPSESERTIFANRKGGPLSQYNVRRTFRAFLEDAELKESGITLRWMRRTGATVLARGMGVDAAAAYLGHGSSAITEGYYIEPDTSVDLVPAEFLERVLRPDNPDVTLLARALSEDEEDMLDDIDEPDDEEEPEAGEAAA